MLSGIYKSGYPVYVRCILYHPFRTDGFKSHTIPSISGSNANTIPSSTNHVGTESKKKLPIPSPAIIPNAISKNIPYSVIRPFKIFISSRKIAAVSKSSTFTASFICFSLSLINLAGFLSNNFLSSASSAFTALA